jgi:putative ABC transport system permease protein
VTSREAFRVALEALRANRLRSGLTTFGVIIGVIAVVLLVAIGSGAKQKVEQQVEGLGSNLVIVVPGKFQFGSAPSVSRLQLGDKDLLAQVVGNPQAVTALLSSGENVRAGTKSVFVTIVGTDGNLTRVFERPLSRGRAVADTDVDIRRRVAVLGSATAQALFGDVDPLGRQVTIAGVRFRVVGIYSELGSAFGVSRDEEIHIPLTTAQRLFGAQRVDDFVVKAPRTSGIDQLQSQLVAALQQRYRGEEFSAVTQTQILGTIGRILGLLTLVLAAIAAISLVVGGVGVSNIMLDSVRESTGEIGPRKAIGARQRDVLRQFLIEAVLLTTVGGVLGIGIGIGMALLIDRFSPLPAVITWWSPALAFGVSVAVGVFFGVAPARRAGRMDPVAALRTE